ncbi:MAG: hypothetical protein JO263_03155, partial [Candidatus Eremiobacteraeota bacterium]|nr:hypothetical protein [Candidatus Eremiobacteraeota bacterium]
MSHRSIAVVLCAALVSGCSASSFHSLPSQGLTSVPNGVYLAPPAPPVKGSRIQHVIVL